jgi:hypothetical protein
MRKSQEESDLPKSCLRPFDDFSYNRDDNYPR